MAINLFWMSLPYSATMSALVCTFFLKRIILWYVILFLPFAFLVYLGVKDWSIVEQAFEHLDVYRENLAAVGRGSEDGLAIRLFSLHEPYQTIARLGYAVVTPLPILYSNVEWNFLAIGTLLQIYFASFAILGVAVIYRDPRMMPLLLGFVIVFFAYSMGTFTFRHITAWFPFAVLIGMFGYTRFKGYRHIIFLACTVALGFSALSYLWLKGFLV